MNVVTSLKQDVNVRRPSNIDEDEWALRLELAAAYRIFDCLGWTLLTFNHISVRLPGPEHHFLINPYGLMYDEITASNLVKIGLDGMKIDHSPWEVNPAGFIIHSAIHENVPEALCIMHTHTNEGVAIACKAEGLSQSNFYSAMLHGQIAYHEFEGPVVHAEEKSRLVNNIDKKAVLVLRNHGLLAHGRTVPEAFGRLWTAQKACETQVLASSIPGKTLEIDEDVATRASRDTNLFSSEPASVWNQVFEALIRKIDSQDRTWRE